MSHPSPPRPPPRHRIMKKRQDKTSDAKQPRKQQQFLRTGQTGRAGKGHQNPDPETIAPKGKHGRPTWWTQLLHRSHCTQGSLISSSNFLLSRSRFSGAFTSSTAAAAAAVAPPPPTLPPDSDAAGGAPVAPLALPDSDTALPGAAAGAAGGEPLAAPAGDASLPPSPAAGALSPPF